MLYTNKTHRTVYYNFFNNTLYITKFEYIYTRFSNVHHKILITDQTINEYATQVINHSLQNNEYN